MTDRDFMRKLDVHHGRAGRRLARGWIVGLTEEELLRCLLMGEAEGEGPAGQAAICWVIRHRIASPGWWGSTPRQVMLWPHQFSCFWSDYGARRGAMRRWVFIDNSTWAKQVGQWYDVIVEGKDTDDADPTGGATHYWNPAVVSPRWAGRLHATTTIGNHQFARE